MTKEELEKEAEEYADKHAFRVPYNGSNKFYDDVDFKASKEGYLAGAEPREKQIQIDAEQIRALQRQNGELTDKVKELEEELEQAKKVKAVEHFEAYGQCRDSRRIAELEAQLEREKNLNQCLSDHNEQLRELIEKMKCLNEEIIKALNECLDYEWLHAHNGKAKYLYLQTVIDIVNEKFEEIKEK